MEFRSEEGKSWRPPGLRAVSGAFGRGVGGEESGEVREVVVKPGFKRESGGKRRRQRNDEVLK